MTLHTFSQLNHINYKLYLVGVGLHIKLAKSYSKITVTSHGRGPGRGWGSAPMSPNVTWGGAKEGVKNRPKMKMIFLIAP